MPKETKEQLELEAEIKNQAQKFITDLNATLPEVMELEYEGLYPEYQLTHGQIIG